MMQKNRVVHVFSERDVGMTPGFPLKIVKDRQMQSVPYHSHNFIELAFVAEGCALHSYTGRGGQTRHEGLIQGDLFSVLEGESHEFRKGRNMVLYNIYLHRELLAPYPELEKLPGWKILFERGGTPEHQLHLAPVERTAAAKCLDRAILEENRRGDCFETVVTALFLEFIIPALRKRAKGAELGENSFGVLESISMMEGQPERTFTLSELAKFSGMSVPSYTKKFRTATGVSPMEYLLKVRLLKVCDYLTMTDLSIGEISGLCGFCSANYMIKLFRREIGITPAQYRKEQRKDL